MRSGRTVYFKRSVYTGGRRTAACFAFRIKRRFVFFFSRKKSELQWPYDVLKKKKTFKINIKSPQDALKKYSKKYYGLKTFQTDLARATSMLFLNILRFENSVQK